MQCQFICTQCGKEYPFDEPKLRCDRCLEPLEVAYGSLKPEVEGQGSPWSKFKAFYPFGEVSEDMSLGKGGTPLIPSLVVGRQWGLDGLYLKDETQNPTWSFKDRGTLCGIQHAISLGYERIGTISTGNMAASVPAYGARVALPRSFWFQRVFKLRRQNPSPPRCPVPRGGIQDHRPVH